MSNVLNGSVNHLPRMPESVMMTGQLGEVTVTTDPDLDLGSAALDLVPPEAFTASLSDGGHLRVRPSNLDAGQLDPARSVTLRIGPRLEGSAEGPDMLALVVKETDITVGGTPELPLRVGHAVLSTSGAAEVNLHDVNSDISIRVTHADGEDKITVGAGVTAASEIILNG